MRTWPPGHRLDEVADLVEAGEAPCLGPADTRRLRQALAAHLSVRPTLTLWLDVDLPTAGHWVGLSAWASKIARAWADGHPLVAPGEPLVGSLRWTESAGCWRVQATVELLGIPAEG